MDEGKFASSLNYFKALGDANRLKIINLVRKQEMNVGALAEKLQLKEPTVSHHLSKLHSAGIVNRRIDGNQHFYRLNEGNLKRWGERLSNLDALSFDIQYEENDTGWIDELKDFDEDERKTLRDYTHNGRIRRIPKKRNPLLTILRWLSTKFEDGRMYSEREVNAIITPHHEDYAGLRRDLVDFGYLRRERGGGKYWLAPEDEEV